MCDAVDTVKTATATPEEVWIGGQDDDTRQALLNRLVREVEEGLATVSVQENVEAESTLSSGGLSASTNARGGGELVNRAADFKAEWETTAKGECVSRCLALKVKYMPGLTSP